MGEPLYVRLCLKVVVLGGTSKCFGSFIFYFSFFLLHLFLLFFLLLGKLGTKFLSHVLVVMSCLRGL